MEGIEGVGIHLYHKADGKLFQRYPRNACESYLTECRFADDTALLAATREGAEKALQGYMKVAQDFGLSVSIAKTKFIATGWLVLPNDEGPIHWDDCSSIEAVQEFQYLGSIVERSGRADSEVGRRVMQASRAFGCLRRAVYIQGQRPHNEDEEEHSSGLCAVCPTVCWTP